MTTRRGFMLSTAGFAAAAVAADRPEHDRNLSVFLSDTHISPSVSPVANFQFESLRAIIDEILAMRPLPANAVVFGDIALGKGMTADYERIRPEFMRLSAAGVKLHYMMGNHDHRRPFLDVFPEVAADLRVKGRLVSVVDLGSCDLVLLDSLDEIGEREGVANNVSGAIDKAQFEWLWDHVPRMRRPFVCGAHHSPGEMTLKTDSPRRAVLQILKESPHYMGWVQGHVHRWIKGFNAGNQSNELATFRHLFLPSTGHWGDIGYAVARSFGDHLEVTLRMRDFWYPHPARAGQTRPRCWDDMIREKKGETCLFSTLA